MPDWNWGESQSENGVVHQSVTNTDNDDAGTLKQGYDLAAFSEVAPDPVAFWSLHEDSGTTAHDVAGTYDGTYNGPILGQTGVLGTTAASFDGQDDYVDLGTISVGDGVSQVSVIGWFNLNNTDEETHIYSTGFDGTNLLRLYVGGGKTNPNINMDNQAAAAATIPYPGDNQWIFAAGTYDAGDYFLFVNGQTATDTDATTQLTDSGQKHTIGCLDNQGSIERFADGRIGFVGVWHDVLTQSEIQALYDVVKTQGTWTGTAKTL